MADIAGGELRAEQVKKVGAMGQEATLVYTEEKGL